MVTDQQVRRLFKLIQTERNFGIAAMKAGMDEKTARKYRKQDKLRYNQMLCIRSILWVIVNSNNPATFLTTKIKRIHAPCPKIT